MDRSEGFPPIERNDARILVLGSLPGRRSIAAGEYYAHPRNAFWPIMEELLGIRGTYEERCRQLRASRVALWDVLARSVRPGSLDAHIRLADAVANDLPAFFDEHREITLVAFNGRKAEQLFGRFVDIGPFTGRLRRIALPSTSPALAALSFRDKLAAWRDAIIPAAQASAGPDTQSSRTNER